MTRIDRTGLLRVDLTDETIEREPIPETWRRHYIGGKGIGARYLYEELAAGVDPLGPANVVLVLLGPLTGLLPGDARYVVVTKSPLTDGFVDSYGGGTFPTRFAGSLDDCLGVLVEGRADQPLVLELGDDGPRLTSADSWGSDIPETSDQYPASATACIGVAGEHRVSSASIATDGGDHQAARGGVGAVFGAKRLKAIIAHGDPPPFVDDPPTAIADLQDEYRAALESVQDSAWQRSSETLETIDFANEVGILPTRGWQETHFEGSTDIGIEAVRASSSKRERDTDAYPGGFRIASDDGETVPRGATFMTLGAGLGIDDFDAVLSLGRRCDHAGLDVITAGNAIAWAIRASARGFIDRDLEFGDATAAADLLDEMAARSSELGDALADGVAHAAAKYGGTDLIPTVKQLDAPAYDPRGAPAMALAYATSDRGACHRRSRPVESEVFAPEDWSVTRSATTVIADQNTNAVLWSLIADDLVTDVLREDLGAAWLNAVGWDIDVDELERAGRRIWTVTRLFNAREGFDRLEDHLPATFTHAVPDGPTAGRTISRERFERMLDAYYAARGWTAAGHPSRDTLRELDILDLTDTAEP